jgi:hypothetical protein
MDVSRGTLCTSRVEMRFATPPKKAFSIHSNGEYNILDFKQVWSFFLKPRRISAARIKRIMITNGSLVDLFKLVIAFHRVLMLKELLGIFEISVGNFMRNGCHVGLVPLF